MRLRPRSVTLLAALVAATLTDLVVMVPGLHYAYRSVPLHAMLETTATLIALLTSVLLWGRLRQRQRLDDLLLFVALALLTTTNPLFAAIPAVYFYNYFTNRVKHFSGDMDDFSLEFLNISERNFT